MPTIALTPLEVLLLGGAISLLSGIAVRLFSNAHFVAKKECRLQRDMLLSHKNDMNVIFAMLRAVIAHMTDLTAEERERILNLRLSKDS